LPNVEKYIFPLNDAQLLAYCVLFKGIALIHPASVYQIDYPEGLEKPPIAS
jgi:hypothetical protein